MKKYMKIWASWFFGLALSASANSAVMISESTIRVTDLDVVPPTLLDQLIDHATGSGTVSSSLVGLQGYAHSSATDAAYIAAYAGIEAAGGSILTTATSRVNWKASYVASASGDYFWNFVIPSGFLSAGGASSFGGWASYDIIIDGGSSSWRSSAKLLHDSYSTYSYSTTGESLGGVFSGSGQGADPFKVVFDEHSGSLGIGYFNSGDTIEITYSMMVESAGPGHEVFVRSAIGDPAQLAGGIGGTLTRAPANVVSEPSSYLLAGFGLFSAFVHRRRSLRKNCSKKWI